MKVAARGAVAPFLAMEVLKAANRREAAGGDVLHMEVGQPGAGAPQRVIEAAKRALDRNQIGYTDALGIAPLRERIARHYRDYYGVEVAAERVVVTTGSSGGFLLAFLAAFDAGDRVALVQPGYPAYRNILLAYGLEAVLLEAGPESRFQPSVEMLEAEGGRLDGLVVASPANPTGTMLSAEALKALVDYCAERRIRLFSDEIYHGITYEGRAETALSLSQDAVVVNSFSKYYCMTGWRLGWLVLPEELVRPVERLAQNLFISSPTVSQIAAVEAFDCAQELDANVARYAHNRALLLAQLPKAGFDKLAPADGAFYLFADVGRLTNDSQAFCRRMLEETGVATTPGVDFDVARGQTYVRFSFAGPEQDMAEAAARLGRWLS
ncbi:MAG: aminotransferase class I/II-fold pyridoxal phosphate-dependent enzyme [Alphaproteobacteria bacterium]|nr:aminotransferase class I/II-fold pyridoxal phosphate-dependent enzyme [Alphaproteobacteria bacterium]